MEIENNTHILHGPKSTLSLPNDCIGKMLIDAFVNNPTDEFLICSHTNQTIAYKQIFQEACNLAESLRKFGCNENTLIALCSENHLKYFIPLLAALCVGSTSVPLNPTYSIDELKHIMFLTKPKIVFCSQFTVKIFLENRDLFDFVEKIIIIDPLKVPGVETMEDFAKNQIGDKSVEPKKFEAFNENPAEHVAVILTSSGTTGMPKGVMLTDQNLIMRISQFWEPIYVDNNEPPMRKVAFGLLPFFHGYGIVIGLSCMYLQQKMVIMKKFDEDLFLKNIQDYKIKFLALAPPLVIFLSKSPKVENYDLSSVTGIGSGGAPLKKKTENALKKGYGLTECLAATLCEYGVKDKEGSTGKPATFTTMKVIDPETGRSLGPNKTGEICIKSPLVMKGYYKNEEATRESFTSDGWLRTGDLGYYDDEGFFYVVDRLKELIKYKAYQVAPAELEAILLNHPKISDVGVVGLPDELSGEVPIAFVTKHPGVTITEKEIQNYVAERVSPHKRLRGGVIFVPAIPKNPSGKILRKELRKMLIGHKIHRESKL